ncbi:uncharacterized protein BP5553_02166 [Venustampulla echinocandica]|uniref:Uncharacterized protein n=1 Tax=Venustampulla echinocandica TaxID=2656787 RepID=A0A370U338_9HELO|nr:uncharacterized protein BP5553_02166 [Venustampulla echinocandica]RDL42187.1 hypothetical protein BP5553_02166 [Venustampulla echinocandica]
MWKKLNNPKGARQPSHPQPKIDEQPYSPPYGLGVEVHSPESPLHGNMPPPRETRGEMSPKNLPQLPFELAPPSPPEHRNSKFRPASSIYSQPSPNPIVTRFPGTSYVTTSTAYTDEVSPPSSPDFGVIHRSQNQPVDEEVSPIDEMPDISRLGVGRPPSQPSSNPKPTSSNIPVLRREKRRNQAVAAVSNLVPRKQSGLTSRPTKDPSWDPYSGEPTTSGKGKKQSTKPGEFGPPSLRSAQDPSFLGNEAHVSATPMKNASFGDRVRKLRSGNPPEEKPQWRGASGRVTLVPPAEDRLDLPPLSMPPKSTQPTPPPRSDSIPSARVDPIIRPVRSDSPSSAPHTGTQPHRNVPTDTQQRVETISPEEKRFREQYKVQNFINAPPEPYVQPPSRFSVSTAAPSEARTTPRPSTDTFDPPLEPPPPMPTPPSSLLDRTRPKVGRGPREGVSRKPLNTSSPVVVSISNSNASKRASNVGKTLPVTPAEQESHDLITSLQAQLDDLTHRRKNISMSIRQMTELMPTDSVTLTAEVRTKREEEKRKVEGLREEEADVRRQEHEIGLRLHRAWKRKDKEATYEPTGLWVRRVTG